MCICILSMLLTITACYIFYMKLYDDKAASYEVPAKVSGHQYLGGVTQRIQGDGGTPIPLAIGLNRRATMSFC